MPLYFFRIHDENGKITDEHGAEFASDKKACIEAMCTARQILAHKTANGDLADGFSFEIARADGSAMDSIPLKSVAGAF